MIGEDIIEEEEEDYDQFSLTESSTVVEKFIRVIESSSNSKFENTTATTKSSNDSEITASNTNREDIRRKLAFNKPEPTSFEAKAKSNKKNDLEGGFHRTFQFFFFFFFLFPFCFFLFSFFFCILYFFFLFAIWDINIGDFQKFIEISNLAQKV